MTPAVISFKNGEYALRFSDSGGRYEETKRTLKVDKDSDNKLFVVMNRWLRVKVGVKDEPGKPVSATVKISGTGNSFSAEKKITSDKPVRFALPRGKFKVVFDAGREYKLLTYKNYEIGDTGELAGQMEYNDTTLKVIVKETATQKPVGDAYIWMRGQIAGRTDSSGFWENTIMYGTGTVRVVAKGYLEKAVDFNVVPGAKEGNSLLVSLDSELPAALPRPLPVTGETRRNEVVSPRVTYIENPEPAKPVTGVETSSDRSRVVVICPNCKKEYPAGSRKLRFCINCGKPLKWE